MTDREEIERLLNRTGRTLEELPEFYPEEKAHKLYLEVTGARLIWENIVLYQADVAEMLIGALRDALSERDTAVDDLSTISHCFTCSNQDLNEDGWCKNSGGGGAPFMKCPGYVWDKEKRNRENQKPKPETEKKMEQAEKREDEQIRCKDCKKRGMRFCPMMHVYEKLSVDARGIIDREYVRIDNTTDEGFCHAGERGNT